MTKRNETSILNEAINAYQNIDDPRRKEILHSAIKHLHAFTTDVDLTREEWLEGVFYLTDVGQICGPARQEFILLSDLLGLSALIEFQDRRVEGTETPGSVAGPFHATGSPFIPIGGTIDVDKMSGSQSALVKGTVKDADGNPLVGAILDIWQTAPNRKYAIQDDTQSENNLRGKQKTDEQGNFAFYTVKPVPYSVPRDGPAGKILDISHRHGMRAAHIHFEIHADGFKPLITEVFPSDDPYLENDTVFGACKPLQVEYKASDDSTVESDLIAVFNFVLQKEKVSQAKT